MGIERVVERGTLLHWHSSSHSSAFSGCTRRGLSSCSCLLRVRSSRHAERSAAARAGRLLGLAARLKLGHHSVKLRAGAHSLQLLK